MDKIKRNQILELIHKANSQVCLGQTSRRSLCDGRGRLSKSKLKLACSTNSMISDPACYQAYRRLKFFVEGIQEVGDQVRAKYGDLIEEVSRARQVSGVTTRTKFSRKHQRLYRRITAIPESSTIFRLGGLCGGHSDFFYFSDDELIHEASAYASMTELKNQGGEVHRHIKGRELESALMRAHPKFVGHFYVGLNGERFRSIPELVLGNWLSANGVECLHDAAFAPPEWGGKRPLQPDFLFKQRNFILELAQSSGGTGTRRVKYDLRTKAKKACYESIPLLKFDFLIVDQFFTANGFDVHAFLLTVREILLKNGIDSGPVPDNCASLRTDNLEVKSFYLEAPVEVLIDHFVEDHQLRGIADFQNYFSPAKHLIRLRPDYEEIINRIRQIGRTWARTKG